MDTLEQNYNTGNFFSSEKVMEWKKMKNYADLLKE